MNVSVLLQTVSFPSVNLHSNIIFHPVSQAQKRASQNSP